MEKLGMARRRRRFFAGLLTFTLFILSTGRTFPLIAPDEPLKVLCEADQENLEAGRPFNLALAVNHSAPHEVTVIPPNFEGKFRLERQRSFTRLVRGTAADAERWSVFEFTLIPLEEGPQVLPPFAVHAREQSLWTADLPLAVAPARAVLSPPVFRWATPFPVLKIGEWSVFRLTVTDPAALPQNALQRLRFEPPPEAVVESALLPSSANRNAAVIELRILPMRPGPFTIKAVRFEAELRDGTVTPLLIPELRAVIQQ
ncbi:MAG: hypothetical protein LBK61_08560 [Spirochaetaceae bacterium]|jgi:hypothetical protein|nr:hypothetical protein [Spirochaetaceae bacterium]